MNQAKMHVYIVGDANHLVQSTIIRPIHSEVHG